VILVVRRWMSGLERPRYFAGKLLTADDFALEQRYQIEKRWLLNRMFHSPGIVHGLAVAAGEKGMVTVAPGFALDPRGREINVCEPRELAIRDGVEAVFICLMYAEVETDRGTVRETYELTTATDVPEQAVVLGVIDGGVIQARGA
jgi:hypothetical protein